jgi:hypothetical protein
MLTSGELVLPPGYWAGSAADINDNDVVVGYARDSTAFRAARWLSLSDITLLPNLPGTLGCQATHVNEHGMTLGFCYAGGGQQRVVLWTTKGAVMDLGRGEPAGINNRGDVVWTDVGVSPQYHVFLRDKSGGVEEIFGGPFAKAWGINNRGMVSGSRMLPGGSYETFTWSRAKGLEVIAFPLGWLASGGVLNDAGHLAGVHQRRTAGPTSPLCVGVWFWNADDGFDEVECTVPMEWGISVRDLSNADVIGGGVTGPTTSLRPAILWEPDAGRIAEYNYGYGNLVNAVNGLGRAVGYVVRGDPNVRLNPHPFVF